MKHITKHRYHINQQWRCGTIKYKIVIIDYLDKWMEIETTNQDNIDLFGEQFRYRLSFYDADYFLYPL